MLQNVVRPGLDSRLSDLGLESDFKRKIIEHAVSDVHYVDKATPDVAKAVLVFCIKALTQTHSM